MRTKKVNFSEALKAAKKNPHFVQEVQAFIRASTRIYTSDHSQLID
ncbi:hypothetical protein J4457_04120 [Candidatus Woesearchaeota archaeon]|nr:hypothetical protein [Candidatus Woesearchaeota archaeon]